MNIDGITYHAKCTTNDRKGSLSISIKGDPDVISTIFEKWGYLLQEVQEEKKKWKKGIG